MTIHVCITALYNASTVDLEIFVAMKPSYDIFSCLKMSVGTNPYHVYINSMHAFVRLLS